MDKILFTSFRQIASANSQETPACVTTVCKQRLYRIPWTSIQRNSRWRHVTGTRTG